jgi:hypothetical protein
VDGSSTGIKIYYIAVVIQEQPCPLLAQSRHSTLCGFMSAFGGKADIGHITQIEALQSDPTIACGDLHTSQPASVAAIFMSG